MGDDDEEKLVNEDNFFEFCTSDDERRQENTGTVGREGARRNPFSLGVESDTPSESREKTRRHRTAAQAWNVCRREQNLFGPSAARDC